MFKKNSVTFGQSFGSEWFSIYASWYYIPYVLIDDNEKYVVSADHEREIAILKIRQTVLGLNIFDFFN